MKEPRVELKNVKTFEGHDTMMGFNADVYVDGVKCTHVHDSAHGGCYEYSDYTYENPKAELIKEKLTLLDAYIASPPEEPMVINDESYMRDGKQVTIKIDLDSYINDKLIAILKIKEDKKFERKMKKALLFGVPDTDSYVSYSFRQELSKIKQGLLQAKILELMSKECKKGVKLLNTNLAELGIVINQ